MIMKQLLRIKPKGKFFFGGDRTFSNERQSYFAHSEYFPQQTALLGMLRYAILEKENMLNATETEKAALIGKVGFDGENDRSFGKILGLSPVFILEEKQTWWTVGKDQQLYRCEGKKDEFRHVSLNYSASPNKPKLSEYSHKEPLKNCFAKFGDSSAEIRPLASFYEEHPQVGITKAEDGKTLNDAFYKHHLLTFKRETATHENPFSFGLWVESDYDFKQIKTVFLGRESVFSLSVESGVENAFEVVEKENAGFSDKKSAKIVLLSNAFVDDLTTLRALSDFIIADEPVPFKFITRATDNRHYKMPPDHSRRSAQYYLLERGTVFFPKDLIKTRKLLDIPAFQSIGYNHYRILTR